MAFQNLKELSFSLPDVAGRVRKITPVVEAEAAKLEEALQQQARAAIAKLVTDLAGPDQAEGWASVAGPASPICGRFWRQSALRFPTAKITCLPRLKSLPQPSPLMGLLGRKHELGP